MNVTNASGSGTKTSWTVFLIAAIVTVASPPVAIADGGTGATAIATARANLATQQVEIVLGILSTPPGSPTLNDQYLVGDAPTGAWSALENEVVRWNGSTWDTIATVVGTAVVGPLNSSLNGNQMAFRSLTAGGLGGEGIWANGQWAYFNHAPIRPPFLNNTPLGTTTLTVGDADGIFVVDRSGSAVTITLPDVGANDAAKVEPGSAFTFVNIATGASDVTLNVSGGGTINGSTTYIVANAVGATVVRAVDVSGLGTLHYYVH